MDTIITVDNPQSIFNYVKFINFLKNNNVFSAVIAAIISERVNEITNSLTNNIILPVINRDGDGDGVSDIKSLEDYKIKCFGITFGVGKFITALIKFIIISYVIFIFISISNKYIN
jgi:large conductance mechanosensitive channel